MKRWQRLGQISKFGRVFWRERERSTVRKVWGDDEINVGNYLISALDFGQP